MGGNLRSIVGFGIVCVSLLLSVLAGAQQGPAAVITGTIEAFVIDTFDSPDEKIEHWLVADQNSRMYRLKFDRDAPANLHSGTRVRVHGRWASEEIFAAADGSSSSVEVLSTPAAAAVRTVGVIIVNFQDTAVTCTVDRIGDILYPDPSQNFANPSVKDFYDELSYGQVDFEMDVDGDGAPDVFGPFTISASSSSACDQYNWAYEAEDLAVAAGMNLSLYQHIIYVLPSTNTCGWAGLGNLGCGTVCRTWVARCDLPDVYAHELGHNISMHHASTDTNNDSTMESEYGDYSDVMGYGGVGLRQPSAPHKDQMGWLAGDTDAIQTVTSSGTYYIAPIEWAPWETTNPQILKIVRSTSPSEHYYLSYRVKLGYDSTIRTGYADRLTIHWRAATSGRSHFIDALLDGESFQASGSGLTVTQLWHDPDPATGVVAVDIQFGCATVVPSALANPSSQLVPNSTHSVNLSLSVTNNDSGGCGNGTFTVAATPPAGWSISPATTQTTLAPGSTTSLSFTLTSPASAASGNYTTSFAVSDSSGNHSTVTATSTQTVDTTAPGSVNTLSASVGRRNAVSLAWNAVSDPLSGIREYRVYRDSGAGFVLLSTTGGTSSSDGTGVSGTTYRYYVIAVDNAGNASIQGNIVSVTLDSTSTKPGGGSGGGKGGGGKP